MDLTGKAALVTGGASGIGAALVGALTEAGACVLAVDIDDQGLAALSATSSCATMSADITTRSANSTAAERCVEQFGSLDLSFLNAGILDRKREEMGDPFAVNDLDFDRYELARSVLLDAVVHGTAAAAAHMDGSGSIVVTASAAGLVPWHPTPIYSAMKHGAVGWVRAIAPALERDGVRINAICPGGIATPLLGLEAADAEGVDRLLAPADVAAAMIEIAVGEQTGDAWSMVASRGPVLQQHDFNAIPDFP